MAKPRATAETLPAFGPLRPDETQPRPLGAAWATTGPIVVERPPRLPVVGAWAWWLPSHERFGAVLVVILEDRDLWIPMNGDLRLGFGGRVLVGQTRAGQKLVVRGVTEADAVAMRLTVGNRPVVEVVAEALTRP